MSDCAAAFIDVDLVFFDPDNGLDVPSVPTGRKKSSKYLYLDEVRAFRERGQSVLIYQHFPHVNRNAFVFQCVERLRSIAPAALIYVFCTPHVVFLLVLHERASKHLVDAAHRALSRWDPRFIDGCVMNHDAAPADLANAQTSR